jgi:S1-C subfamily serine protease
MTHQSSIQQPQDFTAVRKFSVIGSVFAGACFLMMACRLGGQDTPNRETEKSLVSISIHAVHVATGKVENFHATGFVVYRDGYVLTSQKMLPPKAEFKDVTIKGVTGADPAERSLQVVPASEQGAYALLKFQEKGSDFACVNLAASHEGPIVGLDVVALGLLTQDSSARLQSQSFILTGEDAAGMYVSDPVSGGPSMGGSPVFDRQGALVGMVLAVYPEKKSTTVVPIHLAIPLLSRLEPLQRWSMPQVLTGTSADKDRTGKYEPEKRVLPKNK